jgi:hypothetical protein
MKKRSLLLAVLMLLPLAACTQPSSPAETVTPAPDVLADIDRYDDYFVYPLESVRCYTVDEDGVVYLVDQMANVVTSYDLDGNELAEYEIVAPGSINTICFGGGKLYITAYTARWPIQSLYSFDLETREQELLITLEQFGGNHVEGINKIEYLDGRVYILAVDPAQADWEVERWPGDYFYYELNIPYQYDGTVLAAYDVRNGDFEIVYGEILSNFTVTDDGQIMLFAYDSEGGYFFQNLTPSEGFSLGEKIYCKIRELSSFAFDGSGIVYVALGEMSSNNSLMYRELREDSGVVVMSSNVWQMYHPEMHDGVIFWRGFTFIRSDEQLKRLKNSAYIKEISSIRIISPSAHTFDIAGEKFNIDYTILSKDEYALTVLSRDKAYDLAHLHSLDDFVMNIKNKGSFYPLNDVPGVQEFLDACFPYIRDAATDDSGVIWMIPVETSTSFLLYHEENCREAGIDFTSAATVSDIIENVRRAAAYDPTDRNYFLSCYSLLNDAVSKYLRSNITLDTPEFRQMAPELKAFWNERENWGDIRALQNPDYPSIQPHNLNVLFAESAYSIFLNHYVWDDLYVAPITGSDGDPNSVGAEFLYVNPYSDNLEITLEYVTAVCEYMMTRKDSFMSTDSAMYTDSEYARRVYALYENSVIDFNIPNEIFAEDFDRYLRDEISLDELIKEADRKLAMYHGE